MKLLNRTSRSLSEQEDMKLQSLAASGRVPTNGTWLLESNRLTPELAFKAPFSLRLMRYRVQILWRLGRYQLPEAEFKPRFRH